MGMPVARMAAVAGAGMSIRPWAHSIWPLPVCTGLAEMNSGCRELMALQMMSVLRMASPLPTSWKWASSTSQPWTWASARLVGRPPVGPGQLL